MPAPVETRPLRFAVRNEDGMLICQRCSHHWRPTSAYPKLCPKCYQSWDSTARWGKFAKKAHRAMPALPLGCIAEFGGGGVGWERKDMHTLLCSHCKGQNLHESGIRIIDDNCTEISNTIELTVPTHLLSNDPGIHIALVCEYCEYLSLLHILYHKGETYLHMAARGPCTVRDRATRDCSPLSLYIKSF